MARPTQYISIWLFFLIIVGGIFIPALGLLVFLMMLFFLSLSYFKGRYWCWHLCPRGAFLDIVLSRISPNKKVPLWLTRARLRWGVFFVFMILFIAQLSFYPKDIYHIGWVFVRMCLATTAIAILLGLPLNARAWCMICPMGTLQGKIHTLNRKKEIG